MTFTHLNNLLHDYKDCFPEEKVPATKMIQFLKNDENCFNRDNWYGHFTGSAWIVDYSREWVLMTHHRQLNLWLQFGKLPFYPILIRRIRINTPKLFSKTF